MASNSFTSISVLAPNATGVEYFDQGVYSTMTDMIGRQLVALPDDQNVPQSLIIGASSNLILQSRNNMNVKLDPSAGVDFFHATGTYNETLTESKFLSLSADSNVTSLQAPNAISISPGDASTTTKLGSMFVTENSTTQLLSTQKYDFRVMKDITIHGNFQTTGQFYTPYINTINLVIDQNFNTHNQVVNGNMYGNNMNIWINKEGTSNKDTNRVGYGFRINSNSEQLELFKYKRYTYVDSNGISQREGKTQYRRVAQFGMGTMLHDSTIADDIDAVVFETLDSVSGPSNLGLTPSTVAAGTGNAVWAMNSNANLYFYGNIGINSPNPSYQLEVIGTAYISDTIISNNYATTSDSRIKSNIAQISDFESLNKIKELKPVSYNLNSSIKRNVGFLAQEVKEVIPEAVSTSPNSVFNIDDFHYMDYNAIISHLVGAVKRLEARLAALENK
jgi:hypothetical protein